MEELKIERSNHHYKRLIYRLLLIVFFINALIQNKRKGPAIIINENGIVDDVSMARAGLIEWNTIKKVEIIKSAGSPHLFIFVRNQDQYINSLNSFKKRVLMQLMKDKGSPIAINLGLIEIDGRKLLDHINQRLSTSL